MRIRHNELKCTALRKLSSPEREKSRYPKLIRVVGRLRTTARYRSHRSVADFILVGLRFGLLYDFLLCQWMFQLDVFALLSGKPPRRKKSFTHPSAEWRSWRIPCSSEGAKICQDDVAICCICVENWCSELEILAAGCALDISGQEMSKRNSSAWWQACGRLEAEIGDSQTTSSFIKDFLDCI